MDAVVLVGGQGTRLRPLTATTPKPMLPVAGVPFVTHLLCQARDAGIDRVVLSTSYRAEVFSAHFGDGASLGLSLGYVTETEPLGTGGGIRNVLEALTADPDEPVVVFNGDVLSGLDLPALLATHGAADADVTLYLHGVEDVSPFGMVPTDRTGRVTAFLEKPMTAEGVVTHNVNAGCYVFRRSVLERIPTGRPVSVERETFPELLAAGANVMGHVDDGYWLDLGTPTAFVTGSCDLVLGRVRSSAMTGVPAAARVLAGAQVADDAQLGGGTTVGAGARVGAGALVEASVLFDGCQVAAGATVRASAVGHRAVVGRGSVLDGAVIADGARVGADNELLAGVRIFPGAVIADGALRFSPDR